MIAAKKSSSGDHLSLRIWIPCIRAKSGADVYVKRLARELSARGHEPFVEWFPKKYQYVPWLLRNRKPPAGTDIIHANSWNAFAFARRGVPLVTVVLHCVYRRGFPQWKSFAQAIFHDQMVGRFEKLSFKNSSEILAISESTRSELIEDFGLKSVRSIPLWIDTEVYSPGSLATQSCRTTTRVLIVGNLSKRKGGDMIVPFCEALGPDFEVIIVAGLRGAKPGTSACGASLEFISGLSEQELIDSYRHADIVASLSRHEGFGYTALEAMACGKPVVAFDTTGLRDVIERDRTGFLVPIGDTDALAAACKVLRNHPKLASEFGTAGRQRSIDLFNAEKAIDEHIELYKGLVTRSQIRRDGNLLR